MNVLSLFNGFSGGELALETLGVEIGTYYSSENNKYANQATQAMFPNTFQLGCITEWRKWNIDWENIDLVTGGFPCQAWSMSGKQLGDKDERGMLFWVMLDIIKHVKSYNPNADFLIENVKMKKEFEQYITTHTENALGNVHKILINSALVSAQNRNRYYWTSFKVEQPEDKGILLKDIIEHGDFFPVARTCELREKPPVPSALCHHVATATDINNNETNLRVYADTGKGPTLNTMGGGNREPKLYIGNAKYRKLTPRECFRLQTVPEQYINILLSSGISNSQLYRLAGNGWTIEVIAHIYQSGKIIHKNK